MLSVDNATHKIVTYYQQNNYSQEFETGFLNLGGNQRDTGSY
jgi:hypothetical protein